MERVKKNQYACELKPAHLMKKAVGQSIDAFFRYHTRLLKAAKHSNQVISAVSGLQIKMVVPQLRKWLNILSK